MASGVQRAVLALYAKDFTGEKIVAGSYIQIAFSLAGFGLMKSVGDLVSGNAADKFGRKYMIVLGTIVSSLGFLVIVFFRYYEMLAIGNAVVGAGEGLVFAAAVALLVDAGGTRERATTVGIFEFSAYIGYSFGSGITGIILASSLFDQSYQTPFYFSLLIVLLSALLAIFVVQDSREYRVISEKLENFEQVPFEQKSTYYRFHSKATVIVCYFNGHLGKIADALMVLLIPILLIEVFHLDIFEMGIIVAAFTFMWAITMPLVGKVSDTFGRKNPIILGLLLEALGIIAFILLPSTFPYLFIASCVSGLGCGLYYPILSSIIVDISSEEEKAKSIGYYRATRDLGLMTGPFIVGLSATIFYRLAEENYTKEETIKQSVQGPFFVIAGLLTLGAIIIAIFVKETRPYWSQLPIVLKHAQTVHETIEISNEGIQAFLSTGDSKTVKKHAKTAKYKEQLADKLEQDIVYLSYASARVATDTVEFLRIARRLDRAGGLMMGVVTRLGKIPFEEIPQTLSNQISKTSKKIVEMSHKTIEALDFLKMDIRLTPRLLLEVEFLEKEIDLLYREMSSALFQKCEVLSVATTLQLRDIIELLEDAADKFKETSWMIRILSLLHLS